ncbi:peptidoglycan-recognition protein LB-like [Bactrocera neohumeralis]|uniref:peptidoglycan-recognition protein LB-like n=1 Tax=Bactrocera neohumeralis TaxID=98809 RepID=UPI0021666081|nr:peptidoglycan-recognition protein LB-like [Bactrocera neohumeralis]
MEAHHAVLSVLVTLTSICLLNPDITTYAAPTEIGDSQWKLIERSGWCARPPKDRATFAGAAPFIIIHHSYKPGMALSESDCHLAMQQIQDFHMDERHWSDIGYSYAICGDGNVYEGRGANVVAAHAPHYNNRSIGLLLIGDFTEALPPSNMLEVALDFIQFSVDCGFLREDYILYGHRQVRNGTICPGDALYAAIQKWPHWQEDVEDIAYL